VAGQVGAAREGEQVARGRGRDALAEHPVVHVDARGHPVLLGAEVTADDDAPVPLAGPVPVLRRHPERAAGAVDDDGREVHELAPRDVLPQPAVAEGTRGERRPPRRLAADHGERADLRPAGLRFRLPVMHRQHDHRLPVADPAKQGAVTRHGHALRDHLMGGDWHRRPRPDLRTRSVERMPRPQREVLGRVLGENVEAGPFRGAVAQDDRAVPAAGVARRDR
jgi:hypothetical protein